MDASGYHRPDTLEYTQDPEANQLIAQDPVAFVIGWILDQQVTVQTAFLGPLKLRQRIGAYDAASIAAMPEDELVAAFHETPAIHRYSRAMAIRVRTCMQYLVDEHGGDPERVWLDAADYADLRKRLVKLPGFGKPKATSVCAVLARRFGLPITGFEADLMPYGSLSDVVEYQDLLDYQERKGVYKQAARAAAAGAAASATP